MLCTREDFLPSGWCRTRPEPDSWSASGCSRTRFPGSEHLGRPRSPASTPRRSCGRWCQSTQTTTGENSVSNNTRWHMNHSTAERRWAHLVHDDDEGQLGLVENTEGEKHQLRLKSCLKNHVRHDRCHVTQWKKILEKSKFVLNIKNHLQHESIGTVADECLATNQINDRGQNLSFQTLICPPVLMC